MINRVMSKVHVHVATSIPLYTTMGIVYNLAQCYTVAIVTRSGWTNSISASYLMHKK